MLADLKQRRIPALALTAMYTGKYGRVEKTEDLHINELKSMKIDFFDTTPLKETVILKELKGGRDTPMLKMGIIFTNLSWMKLLKI